MDEKKQAIESDLETITELLEETRKKYGLKGTLYMCQYEDGIKYNFMFELDGKTYSKWDGQQAEIIKQ